MMMLHGEAGVAFAVSAAPIIIIIIITAVAHDRQNAWKML